MYDHLTINTHSLARPVRVVIMNTTMECAVVKVTGCSWKVRKQQVKKDQHGTAVKPLWGEISALSDETKEGKRADVSGRVEMVELVVTGAMVSKPTSNFLENKFCYDLHYINF